MNRAVWQWLLLAAVLALGAIFAVRDPTLRARPTAALPPGILSVNEAKIVVFASPYAESVRQIGFDVVPDAGEVAQPPGFFEFYVTTTMPKPAGGGMDMPEYFAVNIFTGTLWDAREGRRIGSPLLSDVQGALRDEHHVTSGDLRRFDSLRPKRAG